MGSAPFEPNPIHPRTFPRTAEFNLTRTFVLTDPSTTPVSYALRLHIPPTVAGAQEVVGVEENPLHTGESEGRWWNGTVPGGSTSISVKVHLRTTAQVWSLSATDVGTAADAPQALRDKYLDDEWKISPNSPQVRSLAAQITNSSRNLLDQLTDVYEWLLTDYAYRATATFEPMAPEETIASRGGDSDDFSVLFVSLARELGIPAWLELGLVYDELRDQWGAHGWAAVYLPLRNGTGVVATVDVVNKGFLLRDPYHVLDWSADGDAQHLEDYFTLLSYTPQVSPPFSVSQSISHDRFVTQGTVSYFHP